MSNFASLPTVEHARESGWLSLVADWRDFVFLHFAIPPAELAPHVPYAVDVRDGRAFISLVSFHINHMRPAKWVPPWLGRWLLRPVSEHRFLNVRTYVRGPAGPGIYFLTEWVDNSLSRRLGPLSHGLPYRLARLETCDLHSGGLRRIAVHDRSTNMSANLLVPAKPDSRPLPVAPGSTDAFLFERYLAYTLRLGVGCCFAVRHSPWQVAPFALSRFDITLLEATFPWFRHAEFSGGHMAEDLIGVFMGAPQRLSLAAPACADHEDWVTLSAKRPAPR